MSRKKTLLIATIVVFILLIAGFATINYRQSFKTVTLNVKREGVSVTIRNAGGGTVKEIPAQVGTTTFKLRQGTYQIIPSGNNISANPIPLIVTESGASVDIDPSYSGEYLETLLNDEIESINSLLVSTYPDVISNFTIKRGTLHKHGEWYTTTLIQDWFEPSVPGDVYRTVLHKEDGAWKIIAPPAIVLSAKEHPSIPREILDAINIETGY